MTTGFYADVSMIIRIYIKDVSMICKVYIQAIQDVSMIYKVYIQAIQDVSMICKVYIQAIQDVSMICKVYIQVICPRYLRFSNIFPPEKSRFLLFYYFCNLPPPLLQTIKCIPRPNALNCLCSTFRIKCLLQSFHSYITSNSFNFCLKRYLNQGGGFRC